jgi:hypothetical protein
MIESAFNYSTPAQHSELLKSELMEYNSYLPFYRAVGGATAVNFRDGIRKGDDENVPLQFRYEEADCRVFYEPEHVVDVSSMWKKIADVRWRGAKCVAGGFAGDENAEKTGSVRRAAEMSTTAPMWNVNLPEKKIQELSDSLDLHTDPVPDRKADGIMYQ